MRLGIIILKCIKITIKISTIISAVYFCVPSHLMSLLSTYLSVTIPETSHISLSLSLWVCKTIQVLHLSHLWLFV